MEGNSYTLKVAVTIHVTPNGLSERVEINKIVMQERILPLLSAVYRWTAMAKSA